MNYLILYFLAGVLEDFLVTIDWRLIAEKRAIAASIVSFIATLIGLFILYDILSNLDSNRSIIPLVVYAAGIATGTFLDMKFKLKNSKE